MHSSINKHATPLLATTILGLLAAACGGGEGAGGADGTAAFDQGAPAGSEEQAASAVTTGTGIAGAPVRRTHRGINLAGAEFGDVLPGKEGVDYKWPTTPEIDYFLSKGFDTFRIGFKWERMQPVLRGELDAAYFAKLDALVAYATGKGAVVVLNPHNFARYRGQLIGSPAVPNAAFADFWGRVARIYAGNPRVIFNLTNEPHDISAEQWVQGANAAIAAIRANGASNELHVPGTAWTGAHSWAAKGYGTPNSVAMLGIVDPRNNFRYEVHQYLDPNSGGQSDQCVSATIGTERLASFVAWLRANHKTGYVGEFGGGDNALCNAAVSDMLRTMSASSDVLAGWSWWAAGPQWRADYAFTLEPQNGVDRPQMKLLEPYLTGS